MKKEAILKYLQAELDKRQGQIDMVKQLQIGNLYYVKFGWDGGCEVVIKLTDFNKESLKGQALFGNCSTPKYMEPCIPFKSLKSMKKVSVRELPLHITLGHTWPLGTKCLAEQSTKPTISLDEKIRNAHRRNLNPHTLNLIEKIKVGGEYEIRLNTNITVATGNIIKVKITDKHGFRGIDENNQNVYYRYYKLEDVCPSEIIR